MNRIISTTAVALTLIRQTGGDIEIVAGRALELRADLGEHGREVCGSTSWNERGATSDNKHFNRRTIHNPNRTGVMRPSSCRASQFPRLRRSSAGP